MTSVLVIEDEESLSDPLSYLLRKEGFEVTVCATAPCALDVFDRGGADLVLLDLDFRVPGPSGTELYRRLRHRPDIPVIMLTAKYTELDTVAGPGLGGIDCVAVPFSWHKLRARIRAAMCRYGKPCPSKATVSSSRRLRAGNSMVR